MLVNTTSNIDRPDTVYQWLIDAHAGRSEAESLRINARLIMLLINHIGDEELIREAISIASGEKGNERHDHS